MSIPMIDPYRTAAPRPKPERRKRLTEKQRLQLEAVAKVRDMFAAHALSALAGHDGYRVFDAELKLQPLVDKMAAHAYRIADAMMAERARRGT